MKKAYLIQENNKQSEAITLTTPYTLKEDTHMKTTRFYKIYDTTGLHIANIKKTYDNLANLIATSYSDDLTVYDDKGKFIVSTFGCFLNRVCDGDTRLKILDKLMPLQLGEKEPKDVIYADIEWR